MVSSLSRTTFPAHSTLVFGFCFECCANPASPGDKDANPPKIDANYVENVAEGAGFESAATKSVNCKTGILRTLGVIVDNH